MPEAKEPILHAGDPVREHRRLAKMGSFSENDHSKHRSAFHSPPRTAPAANAGFFQHWARPAENWKWRQSALQPVIQAKHNAMPVK
jgi:hypothetical protein